MRFKTRSPEDRDGLGNVCLPCPQGQKFSVRGRQRIEDSFLDRQGHFALQLARQDLTHLAQIRERQFYSSMGEQGRCKAEHDPGRSAESSGNPASHGRQPLLFVQRE